MKAKFYLAALPLLLVCGSLAAQDVVEIHGYQRSGVGRSSVGGEQINFGLGINGGGNDFRLGNEADDYIELAVDVRAYEEGSTAFKLHFRPAFKEYYQERDATENAGLSFNNASFNTGTAFALRETWGEAVGVFGKGEAWKDASVWAGRRFYQRHDVHQIDYWFWNNSGDGFGIENINLGFAKFHYAFISEDFGNYNVVNNIAVPTMGGQQTMNSHDLRLTDIVTNHNGSLSLGVQIQKTSNIINNVGNQNGGYRFDVMHKQGGIMGGDNTFEVNYSVGSPIWGWYNNGVDTGNKRTEILDSLFLQPTKAFGICFVALYRNISFDVANTGQQNSSQKSEMLGVRPKYAFTKHFAIEGEIGYSDQKENGFYAPGSSENHVIKETLAAEWSPAMAWWSRPSIRLFVTNAGWGGTANPNASWQTYTPANFAGKTSGYTYGAQVEAWW